MSDLDVLGGAVESELRQALRGASISIRSAADSPGNTPLVEPVQPNQFQGG